MNLSTCSKTFILESTQSVTAFLLTIIQFRMDHRYYRVLRDIYSEINAIIECTHYNDCPALKWLLILSHPPRHLLRSQHIYWMNYCCEWFNSEMIINTVIVFKVVVLERTQLVSKQIIESLHVWLYTEECHVFQSSTLKWMKLPKELIILKTMYSLCLL